MFGVPRGASTVVGTVVLYGALAAGLWMLMVRLARHCSRASVDRRDAALGLASRDGQLTGPGAPPGPERRAGSWGELSTWSRLDRPWAVAVVLLGGPTLQARTAPFVDFADRVVDWASLLHSSRDWPDDQRLLVVSAYQLATDRHCETTEPVVLSDMMRHLDDDQMERVHLAMQIHRGLLGPGNRHHL